MLLTSPKVGIVLPLIDEVSFSGYVCEPRSRHIVVKLTELLDNNAPLGIAPSNDISESTASSSMLLLMIAASGI